MFLSPILILALLFSSCDDGEKVPETKEITFSGSDITITGITSTSGILTLDTSLIEETKGLKGNITIEIGTENKGTFSGTVTAPKEATLGESLTWTGTAKVEGGSDETVTKLVIEGTFSEEESTYTVTKATATLQATVTEIALSLSGISNFSDNAPQADAPDAITLTPPQEGVTPKDAINGKLGTDGTVTFESLETLTASDEDTLKDGWKIKAEWTSSESKTCTIEETEIEASKVTYDSGDKKLTFTFSGSDLTINATGGDV